MESKRAFSPGRKNPEGAGAFQAPESRLAINSGFSHGLFVRVAGSGSCWLQNALSQGTTSVVPNKAEKSGGFSPCGNIFSTIYNYAAAKAGFCWQLLRHD